MKTILRLTILIISLIVSQTSAYSQNNYKSVVAKDGDGIYKILKKNGYDENEYYNDFLEINKDKIGKQNSLIKGETYYLPQKRDASENNETPPADIEISESSNKLNGACFYIISGHGGPDPGAVSSVGGTSVSEDEYAYDICMRLTDKLKDNGAKVFMIINDPNDGIRNNELLKIDYDEYCYPNQKIPKDHNLRLKQRADAVNDLYAKNRDSKYHRVIEIHLDSRSNGKGVDVFFYHFPNSSKGKTSCQNIQKVFQNKYEEHQPNRGYHGTVSSRTLLVMKKVLPPVIFMELGNIQSEKDRKRFFDPNNRQAIANWICEGLITDYSQNGN